jgi:hypothetical protein
VAKNEMSGLPLVVAGQTIHLTPEMVPIGSVRLDPKNPRIRFQLQRSGIPKPTHAQLIKFIRDQPAFAGLQKSIRKAGGLHDPVLIRQDGTVVEGNSRVTVFTILHEGNPADPKWKRIPAHRLPKDVSERAISMLMASYHVAGKTKWPAFAKGEQIYLLVKEHSYTPEQIADDLRNMTKKDVEQCIAAYEYLINDVMPHAKKSTGENFLESKWSHALEFVSSRKIGEKREERQFRRTVGKLIAKHQIKGAEIRDLPKVMKSKRAMKALKTEDFTAAKEVLKKGDPTIENGDLRQIKKLTEKIKNMDQEDWAVFTTDLKARKILTDHAKAIHELLSIAKIKVDLRRG